MENLDIEGPLRLESHGIKIAKVGKIPMSPPTEWTGSQQELMHLPVEVLQLTTHRIDIEPRVDPLSARAFNPIVSSRFGTRNSNIGAVLNKSNP